jgi:heme/copper-type cytochrome/quinol oxidase subunit 3
MYNKILKNKKININIKPFFVKRYNDIMLLLHVRGSNNFLSIRPLHYFNDILYTAWPFYIGWSVFFFLFFFLMLMKQIAIAYYLILISFFSLLWMLGGWFYDMIIESFVYGKYSRKLRQAINYGFLLFLVSEAFLFFGFFWGYFDRVFDSVVHTGNSSLPFGIEPLYKNIKPIFATFLLVRSGFLINLSYVSIKYSWMRALQFSYGSIVLGGIFLFIQYMEYSSLLFTINDNVFCSVFYMLTGFHGFHVIVGLIFLLIQQERLHLCQFNRERQQGFVLGVIYWHFVDYIWIFLFISVYVLNWSLTYYYNNINNNISLLIFDQILIDNKSEVETFLEKINLVNN